MRQQSTFRGFGFVLLMLILIAMAAMLPHQGAADKITHQELVTLLSEDHAGIAQVTINQNPQVPTGEVIINMADGTEKQMYCLLYTSDAADD